MQSSTIFPAQYSTLSAKALGIHLQKEYGLGALTCKLLVRNVSDTYLLEDSVGKYIFKIYRDIHRKYDEITAEVELLNILHGKGAKVAYPIKSLNGQQIQQFNAAEGIRYGILLAFAQGKVVTDMSSAQLETVGREMAAVHNITQNLQLSSARKPYNIDTTLIRPVELLEEAFIQYEALEEYEWLKQTTQTIIRELNGVDTSGFSYGYCHYDFLPKNFHFDEDGRVTFFDFDFAGEGYLINDISTFYVHYFLDVTFNKISREEGDKAFELFLESYRKHKPVSQQEIDTIPYFGFAFWVFYLGFQYESYDDWSNIFFGTKFLKDRIGLIKKWLVYTTGRSY